MIKYTLIKILMKASPLHDIGGPFHQLAAKHRTPKSHSYTPPPSIIVFGLASRGSDDTETLNRGIVSRVFKLICFCFCNKGNTKLV